MSHPAIGLLRADMRELQDAWELGLAAANEGYPLDPMHEALVYSAMVLLGMHGLTQLARYMERQGQGQIAAATTRQRSAIESSQLRCLSDCITDSS